MATSIEVKVPDIGDFADVEVIEIHVSPGDIIKAEDALISLESDKATMDVPAPAAGTIQEIKINLGDQVSEGSLIAVMTASAEIPPSTVEKSVQESASTPPPPPPQPQPAPAETAKQIEHTPPRSLPPPVEKSGSAPVHASPAVRRFARELGTDLTQVRGTGPKGRILKDDVVGFIKSAMQQGGAGKQPASTAGAGIPPIPEVDFSKWGAIDVKPLSRIKKLSGAHLHRAWLNIPHVTHHDEADITELESFRKSLKAEADKKGLRITALTFIMKSLVAGLKAFPQFNASLSADGQSLVYKQYFHIGIAVDTPNGLVVPVFRDVDQKGVYELAAEMAEVSARAREGKLTPNDMQGGCISISSLGGIGGHAFTPVVNAPEVAILGVSRAQMKPIWNGTEFIPRLMMPIDLSYDHRVIDGAEAARFCVLLGQYLIDMRRILL